MGPGSALEATESPEMAQAESKVRKAPVERRAPEALDLEALDPAESVTDPGQV